MTNGTSQVPNSEQDLDSIPTAQGGLSRLAIARLKSAGVPVAPLLRRVGLTPEVIGDSEERLSVRSQVALLDEAAIALKDDCLGFTLARDFDPREIGLPYYVMASSQTLGDALKRLAHYSRAGCPWAGVPGVGQGPIRGPPRSRKRPSQCDQSLFGESSYLPATNKFLAQINKTQDVGRATEGCSALQSLLSWCRAGRAE